MPAHANDTMQTTFDTRLMRGAPMDLSRFERGDAIAPGLHALDVMRNDAPVGRHIVRFVSDGDGAAACIDRALAKAIGLALASLSTRQRASLDDPEQCVRIATLVPAARADYDAERLALQVSVPQAALVDPALDAIDPALRDAGIAAFRANYALLLSHHEDRMRDEGRTQAYTQVELGANAAGWRWRHRGTQQWQSGARLRSQTLASTLEHDIDTLDAQLTFGDFHTRGVLFDSIGLRGVRLESDDRMLPPAFQRHAPIVRGVANTPARVQVRQGHVLLYDTMVPPGPFALRDVQPLGLGGALEVRVVEADGRVSTFSVPYTAIPGLLRPGHSRFSVAAGHWQGSDRLVFQSTMQHGLLDRLTAHAGTQLAPDYVQALGGVAFSTVAGAFSVDRARSWWRRDSGAIAGNALRLAYAGRLPLTGTVVDVAAWRRGNGGFRSLQDAMRPQLRGFDVREHTRTDASLRQAFGRGALTFGLVERSWHASSARQRSVRLGWGLPLANFGVLQAMFDRGTSTTATLSWSLPLAMGSAPVVLQSHLRVVDDTATLQTSAAGAFGADRRHAWGAGLSHATERDQATTVANATLATQGRAGRAGFGLSTAHQFRQWSATAEGSAVVHAHGATFGQTLGDTIALVRAPHAHGVPLLHHPAVRLDRAGRALVPDVSPYRRNVVGIEPRDLSPGVHFDWTERSIVPRAGAVLDVLLPTTQASLRRMRIVRATGEIAPFAADVRDPAGVSRGTVGRDGVVLLRIPADATHFDVHWRDAGEALRCRIPRPSLVDEAPLVDTPCTE
jgi:outer membrane usher protein